MNKKMRTVAILNLLNIKSAYIITFAGFLLMTMLNVIQVVQAAPGEYFENSYLLSSGNMLYLVAVVSAILIPKVNFERIMHLNGRKRDFLAGTFLTYAVLAALVSILNLVFYVTLDKSWANIFQVINLAQIFGWTEHGIIIAFFQQCAFLFLVSAFVHTMTSFQSSRSRWLIDFAIVLAFTVFSIAAPLNNITKMFFSGITSANNAFLQISCCLVFVFILYFVNQFIYRKRVLHY